jgi:hypothetical protein
MGLVKQDDHKQVALSLMTMLNEIKTPTEEYKPYILLCDNTYESVEKAVYDNASGGCDVIISIGHHMATVFTQIHANGSPIPTIFVGASNPASLKTIKSLDRPGGAMSGVCIAEPSATDLAEQLKILYPYVTKIHIPYHPQGMQDLIQQRAEALIKALQDIDFEIIAHTVTEPQEAIDWIQDTIDEIQAVLLIEGCIVGDYAESHIAYICAATERIFISSNGFYGIERGAPFAYGIQSSAMLPEVISMVRRFWNDRKLLGLQAVITLPDTRKLFVNRFKLPWLPKSLLQKIYTSPIFNIVFKWVRCPIKIERNDL